MGIEALKQLLVAIDGSQTIDELKAIVENIPLQENGHQQGIAHHLGNAFWYMDLQGKFAETKNFCLGVASDYYLTATITKRAI